MFDTGNYTMFVDLSEDVHRTMVFECNDPGERGERFVKLQIPIAAQERVITVVRGRKKIKTRDVVLNAVRLSTGECLEIDERQLIIPVRQLCGGGNCDAECGCSHDGDEE